MWKRLSSKLVDDAEDRPRKISVGVSIHRPMGGFVGLEHGMGSGEHIHLVLECFFDTIQPGKSVFSKFSLLILHDSEGTDKG